MKKLVALITLFAGITVAQAQQAPPKEKVEVKKTATVEQTVNNVIHPDQKEHNGYKMKRKTKNGNKTVKKVDTENGTATIKTKKAGDLDKDVKTVPLK